MARVEFRLSMPGVGSWNGRWSGEGKAYLIYKTLTAKRVDALNLPRSFYHRWEDGWAASVEVRVMEKGERRRKSDGFSGYDWMVGNILTYGNTRGPDSTAPSRGSEGGTDG